MAGEWTDSGSQRGARIDTGVPQIARVQDYWLGGKDNYAVDRALGDEILLKWPNLRETVRATRAFLARAVHYLADDAGIRQFLDVGTGLPAANNTHEVAQRVAPDARIVYVDNDPIVLAHAEALLTSTSEGATAYIDADARDAEKILGEAATTLDFSRPVAVMLIAILQFIPDGDDPYGLVARFMDAVPSGSYLAVAHPASDIQTADTSAATARFNQEVPAGARANFRGHDAVERFFDGLEILEPGVVSTTQWRHEGDGVPEPMAVWAAVARKP